MYNNTLQVNCLQHDGQIEACLCYNALPLFATFFYTSAPWGVLVRFVPAYVALQSPCPDQIDSCWYDYRCRSWVYIPRLHYSRTPGSDVANKIFGGKHT